jgi:hypothetical protein
MVNPIQAVVAAAVAVVLRGLGVRAPVGLELL